MCDIVIDDTQGVIDSRKCPSNYTFVLKPFKGSTLFLKFDNLTNRLLPPDKFNRCYQEFVYVMTQVLANFLFTYKQNAIFFLFISL